MKVIVVSNGEINNDDFYIQLFKHEDPEYIICADGGASHLKRLGIIPNVIIGDLDSISGEDLNYYNHMNVEIIKYNPKKDETDTQLAIQYAMTLPVEEIILVGMLGTRIDHSLANIYLLQYIINRGFKTSMINENNRIYLINKSIKLHGIAGDIVSLLPFTDRVEGITTKGLYYPLNDAKMEKDNPYGISNIFNNEIIEISIKTGLLLAILARD